jgi:hypothetical protein
VQQRRLRAVNLFIHGLFVRDISCAIDNRMTPACTPAACTPA